MASCRHWAARRRTEAAASHTAAGRSGLGRTDGERHGAVALEALRPRLGRRTYEIFAAHWPHSDEPGAELFNGVTKHVASTTLNEPEWENSKLIEGGLPAGIHALKREDGPELQVHGSANLIQTLLAHELVDEFRLLVFPLVLGNGKRLFDGGTVPAGLKLVTSQASSTGVTMATYRSGAEISYGSFAAETPSETELARRGELER